MSVDEHTGSLLDLIADCYTHTRQREAVERAILEVACDYEGRIDPNVVRRRIPTWVQPQVVGPTYRAMCKAGLIEPDGWVVSDDLKGRNSGKPSRAYRVAQVSP
jgi:hypothetical protein